MYDRNFKGHVALFVAYLIFGLNTPVAKNILEHPEICSAFALTFYRIGGAALLFWTLSLCTGKESVPLRDLLMLFGASVLEYRSIRCPLLQDCRKPRRLMRR